MGVLKKRKVTVDKLVDFPFKLPHMYVSGKKF